MKEAAAQAFGLERREPTDRPVKAGQKQEEDESSREMGGGGGGDGACGFK